MRRSARSKLVDSREMNTNQTNDHKERVRSIFAPELQQMASARLKQIVINAFAAVVDPLFWSTPSSTSGKYHPPDERMPGGLVLHTRRVVRLAVEGVDRYILQVHPWYLQAKEIVIAAALLHDIKKPGCRQDHGEVAALELWSVFEKELERVDPAFRDELRQILQTITAAVFWHMAQWSTASKFLPEPQFAMAEMIVQEADYYASREMVRVDLEG